MYVCVFITTYICVCEYLSFKICRSDREALEDALLKRVMVTPEEVIKRSLNPEAATTSRDGLAKTLYSRLFDWYFEPFLGVRFTLNLHFVAA